MKHTVLIFLLSIVFKFCVAQNLELLRIIDSSASFYSKKQSGNIVVKSRFKSSIAESYIEENFEIAYCKKDHVVNIIAGDYSFLIKRNKYYSIDTKRKIFINYSSQKLIRNEKRKSLGIYPQFNPLFFSGFYKDNYHVEKKDSFFHVYNYTDHFYFEKTNYSIVKYQNFNLTNTGLQIKEWQFVNQQYFNSCDKISPADNFLFGYKQVTSFDFDKKYPSLNGMNFWEIVGGEKVILDNGTLLTPDFAKNKFILFDFFYQSCMPCIMAFKYIKELKLDIPDSANKLVIIGIDPYLQDSSSMEKFKKRYMIAHSILTGHKATQLNAIFNSGYSFPYYILVNPQGEIIENKEGFEEQFFKKVKKIVSE